MKIEISKNRNRLLIKVTPAEQQELRTIQECGGDCQCDVSMHDFLEPLTCNSELEWINPADTGDLTDAPMLGIYGAEMPGCNTSPPILERWAFLDYQVRSVLEDLRDKGECVFVS